MLQAFSVGRRSGGSKEKGSALVENIEALLFAGVLALIIHQYVFQAFKIPTGSMAPTLLGQHKDLECPNCGRWFPINDRSEPINDPVVCSNCGHTFDRQTVDQAVCTHFPARPKNLFWRGYYRVLAGRFIYNFSEPKRWDVMVFKTPENTPMPGQDYIKRIVGMPGDLFDIRRGNIYSNGEIVRKPKNVQEAMWVPVYDSRREKREDGRFGPAWTPLSSSLERETNLLKLVPSGGETAMAGFRGSGLPDKNPINTFLDYNHWNPPYFPVGEVKFDAKFRTEAERFAVVIEQDGRKYKCELNLKHNESEPGEMRLYIEDEQVASEKVDLRPDATNRLTFTHVDASLAAELNGRGVMKIEFEPHRNIELVSSGLFLEAEGGEIELEDITIHRDNYYFLRELGLPQSAYWPFEVPEGQYMMLGDNSRHSSDSRYWGPAPKENIVGKAVIIWWPIGALRALE